ncbi:MAG TPA: DUF1573 domain-containing protein [Chthoniobacteraceae bacterium]|nr:DUF1573 domain-containing protein [Chthoniobacteraceae bacterium]
MKSEPFPNRRLVRTAACMAAFFFATVASSRAQLTWESRAIELHPTLTDTKAVAEFHFTNTGQKPVRITNVETSCGCTTASLDKKRVYAPGEKGTITAEFDIGGRNEPQKETLHVTSTDPAEPEATLQFTVIIPKLLDIDNIFVRWKPGEELKPAIVNIKALGDYPVKNLTVITTNPALTAEVKHEEGSRDFQLVLTPKKAIEDLVIIEIKPDYPKDRPKLFHVYANLGK